MANYEGDIVLHINPRVNDSVLVLNSAPSGNWGGEERQALNITRGERFHLIIMVTEDCFKVIFIPKDNIIRLLLFDYF